MTQTHSSFGGSVADRIINCPGSLGLAEKCPPSPDSVYAREGTMLHKAMETLIRDETLQPQAVIGLQVEDVTLTPALFTAKLAPVWDALVVYIDTHYPDNYVDYPELKIIVNCLDDGYGYVDLVLHDPNTGVLSVIDYKFGSGVQVSVVGNNQLRYYALGALDTLDDIDVTTINLVILQPQRDGTCVPAVEAVTPDDLLVFARTLTATEQLARGEDPPFNAGAHCRWCPGKTMCPVLTALSTERPEVGALAADDLGEMVTRAAALEMWIKAVRSEAQTRLESGHPVAGWKLVAKRGTRIWRDPVAAESWMRQRFNNPDVYTRVLKSPAQAEKVVRASKRALVGFDALVTKSSTGSTLAPVDDARAPIVGFNLGQLKLVQ